MNLNYSILAKYYDKFTHKDCDYIRWSQYLYNVAASCNARELVDIACGTGKMTELLCQRGLKLIGIDQSVEMLAEARRKCKANFVEQDMRKLQLAHQADMAICVNDGVNYLPARELELFFQRVAANIKSKAPFVFDVSSEYKLTQVVGNNVFYWDDDKETLLWSNSLKGGSVEMNLTLFADDGSGRYERFDERHVQYIHTQADIVNALLNSGFDVVEVNSDYGLALCDNALRITFFARKK
ncbi:MAG: class I SAM-dependent methyltransferase [Clostridiales bacterium]|nr:class I SAM-dependent methyltransferase [Clostridiales bacterium]